MIDKAFPKQSNESNRAYLLRVASAIMSQHSRGSLQSGLKAGQVFDWAHESVEIVQANLYPATLKRGEAPSAAYEATGIDIATKRAALSGYRLAALLEEVFGQ